MLLLTYCFLHTDFISSINRELEAIERWPYVQNNVHFF
jgi:hypothetical protein